MLTNVGRSFGDSNILGKNGKYLIKAIETKDELFPDHAIFNGVIFTDGVLGSYTPKRAGELDMYKRLCRVHEQSLERGIVLGSYTPKRAGELDMFAVCCLLLGVY